jgi:hypothetical protein
MDIDHLPHAEDVNEQSATRDCVPLQLKCILVFTLSVKVLQDCLTDDEQEQGENEPRLSPEELTASNTIPNSVG